MFCPQQLKEGNRDTCSSASTIGILFQRMKGRNIAENIFGNGSNVFDPLLSYADQHKGDQNVHIIPMLRGLSKMLPHPCRILQNVVLLEDLTRTTGAELVYFLQVR